MFTYIDSLEDLSFLNKELLEKQRQLEASQIEEKKDTQKIPEEQPSEEVPKEKQNKPL